jgi:hypothetical protein
VLLRLEENRFWLSLADSDIGLWAQGLAYHSGLDVTICEVDLAPVALSPGHGLASGQPRSHGVAGRPSSRQEGVQNQAR